MTATWFCTLAAQPPVRGVVEEMRVVANGAAGVAFSRITDLAVDGTGQIHVVENDPGVIARYNERGVFQGKYGRRGQGPGEFSAVFDILAVVGDSVADVASYVPTQILAEAIKSVEYDCIAHRSSQGGKNTTSPCFIQDHQRVRDS
jgi:hypothetical protein